MSMVMKLFLASGGRRLSSTTEINQSSDGDRVRKDAALEGCKGLRARLVTQGSASGPDVCCLEPWNITPDWFLSAVVATNIAGNWYFSCTGPVPGSPKA